MPDLANRISSDEATLLRAIARDEAIYGEIMDAERLSPPIELVPASGLSACRLCGETISEAENVVVFGFDPYGGNDRWGRLPRAYLHYPDCPPREETPE